MKYFLINILIIIGLTSCILSTTKHLKESESDLKFFKNPYFSDVAKDYVYKANVTAYGHRFSGLMIIKKLGHNYHRIVFTTEFGNKMFDAELLDANFTINFIADELDRKILVNTLKNDFKILLQDDNPVLVTYGNESHKVYKTKSNRRFNYYFVNKQYSQLEKIVNTTKTKEKIIINFTSKDGEIADEVRIEHKGLKLTIELVAI